MSTYAYLRVSTDRQAEQGESLGTQQRTVEGYAMMLGLTIDQLFIEAGVSGAKPLSERPEGARLLAALQPGDVIITSKLDRMFRSALNALQILEDLKVRQISLHMIDLGGDVTGNGISELFFTIVSAFAQAEHRRIRDRIRDVKSDQKSRNRFLGGPRPQFGWRLAADGRSLEADPAEQAKLAQARELRQAGMSYRRIGKQLSLPHTVVYYALKG